MPKYEILVKINELNKIGQEWQLTTSDDVTRAIVTTPLGEVTAIDEQDKDFFIYDGINKYEGRCSGRYISEHLDKERLKIRVSCIKS